MKRKLLIAMIIALSPLLAFDEKISAEAPLTYSSCIQEVQAHELRCSSNGGLTTGLIKVTVLENVQGLTYYYQVSDGTGFYEGSANSADFEVEVAYPGEYNVMVWPFSPGTPSCGEQHETTVAISLCN